MSRSFETSELEQRCLARWLKASRALKKKEDQIYGQKLAEMVKKHSSEAFYAFDDPLEAAVFSVLVEMVRDMDEERKRWTRSLKHNIYIFVECRILQS